LQPLVENAVNHGIAHLPEGGLLLLHTETDGTSLRLLIRNPVDPQRIRPRGEGMGLHIVRQRLERMYGSAGRLDVQETGETFVVTLTVPIHS
jgi:two-component system sensor histidine kinase AlgZ